jgi:signal transduction histidine kinase
MRILDSVDAAQARGVNAVYPVNNGRENSPGQSAIKVAKGPDGAPLLAVFNEFSRALIAAADSAAIEMALLEAAEQIFPSAIIGLWANGASEPRLARAGCRNLTQQSRRFIASVESAVGAVANAPESSVLTIDTSKDGSGPAAEQLRELGFDSYLRVPLIACGGAVDHLSLYFKERAQLDAADISFLAALASQASSAVRALQLHAQTVEQAVQLRRASDELARAHVVKSEFLSVVSHEFRTPLNIIMGYAALMEEELVGTIGAEQRRCLQQIRHASNDLLAMVMSMLQAGGLEAGLIKAAPEPLRLGDFLRQLKSDLRLADHEDLTIHWEIPEALPVVSTDPDKLKQVLHNLIDNAVKFTERGEVRIRGKTVPEHRQVEIKISDTGIGIANDVLPVVFERYRQLDGSITRAYEGLGLGLFIAKELTALLGGKLSVTSEPGKGSTFTVTLPLTA